MITASAVRNLLKNSDTLNSSHTVIAEWNMNRYQQISEYGLYKGGANVASMTYDPNADETVSGKTFYVYDDDDTTLESPNAEYFSSLASVFQASRPDPGIILTQFFPNNVLLIKNPKKMISGLTTASPRYYPYNENTPYDYFNSGKILETTAATKNSGVSTSTGAIRYANPFVVYDDDFPCNKIVIKVQNYRSVPEIFYIDILNQNGTDWETVYTGTEVNVANINTGILEIYYDGTSTWSTTPRRVTDLDQITTPTTELKKIKGIRLRVVKMSQCTVSNKSYNTSLELIEMSPRIEIDLSSYTESFSFNSSMGDSELGLPIGSIVTSTGNVLLSNETKEFLLSSKAAEYRMLTPDVEFKFYQNIYEESSSTTYTIPLKIMYSDKWNIGSDFTADVSLSDKMRLMQDIKVPDMAFFTETGVPFSVIILTLLDNLGITGYEFKKSSNDADNEDTKISNFYCNKERTLVEVLEDLAKGTQSAMYIDAVGKLNVLTKERITKSVSKDESVDDAVSASTDFWMIFDEKYQVGGGNSNEYNYISGYTANVVSVSEERIDPITDGTIKYHTYGIRKQPGQQLIENTVPKEVLEDIPANSIISTGYSYQTSVMWEPGSNNEAVLGAANLLKTVTAQRLKDTFSSFTASAINEQDAIRKMFAHAVASANSATASNQLPSLVIYLDRNDAYMFPDYSGYVMIDNEYISYRGILYSISASEGATQQILFSREELNEKINQADERSAIVPIGLVIEPRLKISAIYDDKYAFRVIGDGRKQFNSGSIQKHVGYNEETSDEDLDPKNKFNVVIGEKRKQDNPGSLTIGNTYDFKQIVELKKIKAQLNLPSENWSTYLGYLKIAGPKGQLDPRLQALSASTASYAQTENSIDRDEIDKLVPGSGSTSFDPYVFSNIERFIYGQVVPLDFGPNLVSTRMRLYAGRKDPKNKTNVMSTLSSIAGVGFGLKFDRKNEKIHQIKSGYFVEVESIGSAAKDAADTTESSKKNLRFYKLKRDKDGVMDVKLLGTAFVLAQTVLNADADILNKGETTTDPVFDLEIRINPKNKFVYFDVYYGGQNISDEQIRDELDDNEVDGNFWNGRKNAFMFVRGDSQAIYENILAAKNTEFTDTKKFWDDDDKPSEYFIKNYYRGGIPPSKHFIFKKDTIKFKYKDFGRLVRQVKKYKIRYDSPALGSKIIDISKVNPQYMILSNKFTPFGGEIVVANTSTTVIALSSDFNLPLYVIGTKLEELSSGEVSIQDFYEKIDDDGKNITDLSFNRSVYGDKQFSIDNRFIQNKSQAEVLLQWIIRNCSRERFKFNIETYPNPLIELGDKIKVYSKDRGYYEQNPRFGAKTFVVSDISYSVQNAGPTMNLSLIEVGAN